MDSIVKGRDASKVFAALRQDILTLALPPGTVIEEASIAAQHSVSRTPIREAIIQLISEGLIIRDRRVARVAPLNFDDLPKIYDALVVASRLAQRLAAEKRTEADLAEIEQRMGEFDALCENGNGVQRQDANVAFHMSIARAGRNDFFSDFYERMLLASSRLSRACFSSHGCSGELEDGELMQHLTETSRQHRLIFEAISHRDVETADRLAVEHQNLSFARLKVAIFSRGSQSSITMPLDTAGSKAAG
ncbi:GntR family transcriptional regulator [Mesorhizobium sp. VK24D]|uniref:GntR family transcriptional regulator n=1 Tax=Mesorhizobium album TaxID=3072314 RepID=A0ABU4Y2J2_9HYPH|nr:GntR family transcriptional regulator [Mesorhizobium sp. VK24D]MDX8480114.1 GntR family transcriptional regulator [Mesorhizobium sp. VK24D]